MQWVQVNPIFQGLSFQRGFEINFKPWIKKPIVFIKEKWSPLGVFGKKISVQKRSLDNIVPPKPRPAAPVFEIIEEQPIGTAPLNIVPKAPVYASLPKVPPPLVPLPKPLPIIVNDYPPIVPPISTNMVIVQPTKADNSDLSSIKGNTLYTDISRVESIEKYIQGYEISPSGQLKPVGVPPTPLKPEPLPSQPIPILLPPKPPVVVTPVPSPPVIENPSTVLIPKPPATVLSTNPAPVPPSPSPSLPPPPGVEVSPPPTLSKVPATVPLPPPPSLPPPSPGLEMSPPPIAPSIPIPITPTTPIPIPEAPTPVLPKEPIPEKEENKEKPPPVPSVPQEVPKTDIVLKNNTFVKGSRVALQFGSVFLTLMAQFFDRARATIDLMTNPPPQFVQ